MSYSSSKRGTKDTKGTVKLINLKQTDNAMAKNEKDKKKTAHMTQHRKLKNKQHEPPKNLGVSNCCGTFIDSKLSFPDEDKSR